MRSFIFILVLVMGSRTSARVFNFDSERFSTYLRGTGGFSNLEKGAFEDSSGASTVFNDKVEFNFSGEIGFALSVSSLTIRLGLEGLLPQELSEADGSDSSGTELMSLNSEALAMIPKGVVEVVLFSDGVSRLIGGFGVGKGNITLTNVYTLTAAGQAAYSGVSDFTEVVKGSALGGEVFMGIESLLVDNVTFTAEVGYRVYKFKDLKHDSAVTTFQGDVAEGAAAVNDDGTVRELDMRGLFVGVGLRFYINLGN